MVNEKFDIEQQDLSPWSVDELFTAVERLQDQDLSRIHLCAFIDGLDEYDGDYQDDLIRLIFQLARNSSIKICKSAIDYCLSTLLNVLMILLGASSRPWNIFISAFENVPRLTLEELTAKDIEI